MTGPATDDAAGRLVASFGAADAEAMLGQLEQVGLVAVSASALTQLELEAARYRKLAALVDEPDPTA